MSNQLGFESPFDVCLIDEFGRRKILESFDILSDALDYAAEAQGELLDDKLFTKYTIAVYQAGNDQRSILENLFKMFWS